MDETRPAAFGRHALEVLPGAFLTLAVACSVSGLLGFVVLLLTGTALPVAALLAPPVLAVAALAGRLAKSRRRQAPLAEERT